MILCFRVWKQPGDRNKLCTFNYTTTESDVFAASIKLSTATEHCFFGVNLIIQIFIYTLRKKLPLFFPPMCYQKTSPRLNEATHHPVLHMHSARREQTGCRTPTHSHTERNRNTQQKGRHGTACTSRATCSLTAQFTLQTPQSSESTTPKMWMEHSSSPHPLTWHRQLRAGPRDPVLQFA